MKKGLRITLWVLAVLLLLLLLGLVAIQSPRVQTALARKAVASLSEKIDGDIHVGRIAVKPFDAIVLQDVFVTDRQPYADGRINSQDTLLSIDNLSARFSLKGLLHKERISVSRLRLDGGSFNLVIEPGKGERPTTNLERVFRLKEPDPNKPKEDFGDILEASKVEVRDFTFRMVNVVGADRMEAEGRDPIPANVIDWNDFEVKADIDASRILVKDGVISGEADHIRAADKTGWVVKDVSGKVKVGHGQVLLDDVHIQDMDSDIHMRYFRMLGNLDEDYEDFLDRVRLEGEFLSPTVFSMQTVSHFAPNLENFTFRTDLTGKVAGTVNDFSVRGLSFREHASGVTGRVEGRMSGLPDIGTTQMDYKVKDFKFTLNGLETFIQEWAPGTKLNLGNIGKGTDFSLDATASGTLDKLGVKGALASNAGTADVNLTLRNIIDQKRDIAIGGNLKTHGLDVGRIAGIDAVGPVSLETTLDAILAKGNPQVRLDSLHISNLTALGYDYSGIDAVGTYSDQAFDGRIVCDDPNLNFLLQGKFDLSPAKRNAAYQFYANVGYADLNALNLDKRGPSKVSFQADANFIRTQDRDLLGEVNLRDVILENANGRHMVGDIAASAHANEDIHRIRFESGFADGTFVGDKSPVAMVSDLRDLLLREELPALLSKEGKPWDGTPYEIHFTFHDAQEVLNFIQPGLYVEKNTALNLKVDPDGQVRGDVTSGRVALGANYLKDFKLDFNNQGQALHADLAGSAIKLGGIELQDNRLTLTADDNRFKLAYGFDNKTLPSNRADVKVEGVLDRDYDGLVAIAKAQPSQIWYNGNCWNLESRNITFRSGDLDIDRLRLHNKDQEVVVDGAISPQRSDTLSVQMDRFEIALLNSFLMDGKLALKGEATGSARIISPTKPTPALLAGIVCEGTYISGRPVGNLQVGSEWNEAQQRFDFRMRNLMGGVRNIDLDGFVRPKDKNIHAHAVLNGLDLGYATPFLEGIFNRFSGGLDGTVRVDGTLDKLKISSEGMRIVDGLLGIDFTNVPYRVEGPVSVDTEGLHFNNVSIADGSDGKGSVNGALLFGGFKDLRMDTHVQFDRMKVLAIPADRESPIYGDVYGTGKVDITGPFDAIRLNVEARTVKDGDLHIPLKGSSTKQAGELLVFKQPYVETSEDPYERMMNSGAVRKKAKGDLEVRVKVRATPAVTAHIDIGEGNTLEGLGSGNIDIRVRERDNLFTINGDYTLNQGSFHVSALEIVDRDFTIRDGSSIRFNGDIMDSDLNVTGVYSTKASLSTLLSSTSSAGESASLSRRQVDCIIGISDKLRNPKIQLDIEIPELDPGTAGLVESALNTEDKVMKQFIYLLIANSFLPNEESGVITTDTSNMLYSNMSGIMAGQLNSIFQKLDIPLDLGLNYQQNESGSNLFDVALSTQLFNNRVIVNGTIGNRRLYGTATEEVTGDLDIDIKLDKPGTVRLNLFSHSADQYTSYLDNSQRNGVGIAYQREFNSLKQFFRDLFKSRAEREEQAAEEALQPVERKYLQIDSTGKAHPVVTNE